MNPFDLTGKVTLVTGANSGLGLGWATGIARAGGDVVIWGRRADANEAAAESLRAYGGRVLAQEVDVSEEEQVVRGMREAIAQMGRLDGAIANAGINTPPPSFAELGSGQWHELLDINLHGYYYTLREAVKHMMERHAAGDPGGSLVVCGSLSVTHGVPRIAHYAAAKGAMASVMKSIAVEYGPFGIRANMVLPGRIATNLGGASPEQKLALEERSKVIPIPRMGTPEDCAGIVVYLMSNAASYHTGDLITVDGGSRSPSDSRVGEQLQDLLDIEAIKRLKARYCRLLDTKQWDEWRTVFTDDARFEGTGGPAGGPDEFVAGVRSALGPDGRTVHRAFMPEIELTGAGTASGVWAMEDYVELPSSDGREGIVGYGYYEEEYRRDEGGWRIAFLRITRLRVDPLAGDPLPPFDAWPQLWANERPPRT